MAEIVRNIPLTPDTIHVLATGSESERTDLIEHYRDPSVDLLQPMELARHAWHWVREKASGREAVLWVPAIYDSEKLNTKVVMVLNPDQPGEMLEFVASDTRLIEGVLPVDFTKREVSPVEPAKAEVLEPDDIISTEGTPIDLGDALKLQEA